MRLARPRLRGGPRGGGGLAGSRRRRRLGSYRDGRLGAALLRPGGRAVESWGAPLFGYCHRARTISRRRAPGARHRARRLRMPTRRRLAGLVLTAAVSAAALLGAGDIRLTRPTRAAPSAPPVPAPDPGAQLARTLAGLLAQLAATHGQ